jgi:hypothetical protein
MNINLNSSFNGITFFKESISSLLIAQHKKILLVASIALGFSCLICAISLNKFRFSKKLENRSLDDKQEEPIGNKKEEIPSGLQSLKLDKSSDSPQQALAKRLELAKLAGTSLKELDLTRSSITDHDLEDIFKACPNIEELNLTSCEEITDAIIEKLPQHLRSLYLGGCERITGATFDRLPQGLQSLGVWDCFLLTNAIIEKLPPGLQWLNLGGCKKLTDAGIEKLPSSLQWLNLSSCNNLTNAVFGKLPNDLETLGLTYCSQLTDDAVDKLPKNLKRLNLVGCKEELIEAAKKKLPKNMTIVSEFKF